MLAAAQVAVWAPPLPAVNVNSNGVQVSNMLFALATPLTNVKTAISNKNFFIRLVLLLRLFSKISYCIRGRLRRSCFVRRCALIRHPVKYSLTPPYDPTQFRTEMQLNLRTCISLSTVEDAGCSTHALFPSRPLREFT